MSRGTIVCAVDATPEAEVAAAAAARLAERLKLRLVLAHVVEELPRPRLQRDARPARGRAAGERPARARRPGARASGGSQVELHDEVGQSMTGVPAPARAAPAGDRGRAAAGPRRRAGRGSRQPRRRPPDRARAAARDARAPRPGQRPEERSRMDSRNGRGSRIEQRFEPDLPRLDPDAQLALYRVTQESLTNVARHAEASSVPARARGRAGQRRPPDRRRRPRLRRGA